MSLRVCESEGVSECKRVVCECVSECKRVCVCVCVRECE